MQLSDIVANREQKNKHLTAMLALLQLEKQQLEADNPEEMANTADQWEALAKEVDALEAAYRAVAQTPLGEHAERIAALDAEAKETLRQMQDVQIACNTLAASMTEENKGSLRDAHKSTQRLSSYIAPYSVSEDGIYFDKKK